MTEGTAKVFEQCSESDSKVYQRVIKVSQMCPDNVSKVFLKCTESVSNVYLKTGESQEESAQRSPSYESHQPFEGVGWFRVRLSNNLVFFFDISSAF